MRVQQATLAVAIALSSVASPMATVLGALLFAGLASWARASAAVARRRIDRSGRPVATPMHEPRQLGRTGCARTLACFSIVPVPALVCEAGHALSFARERTFPCALQSGRHQARDFLSDAVARLRRVCAARPPPNEAGRLVEFAALPAP
jgi:hypothetical protein